MKRKLILSITAAFILFVLVGFVSATEPIMVKDIYTGLPSSGPGDLTNVNGTLFLRAGDGTNGFELWKSNGTEAGTVMVKDIYAGALSSGPMHLTDVNGTLFFRAFDASGSDIWKSDGSEAGTVTANDIYSGSSDSYPWNLTSINGTAFFSRAAGKSGGLYKRGNEKRFKTTRIYRDSLAPGIYLPQFIALVMA